MKNLFNTFIPVNYSIEKVDELNSKGKIRLFVYGTLRRGGRAAHLLRSFKIVEEGVRLKGFALYDAGWYPFAVRAAEKFSIVGDVFEVPVRSLPELDEYEGPEYGRAFLEEQQFSIYLKVNNHVHGLVQVANGDWLTYWKKKEEPGSTNF